MLFSKDKSLCEINQSIIVSRENGREHRAQNVDKNDVYQYKVDGDILSPNTEERRCDYIVENETKLNA